MPHALFLLAHLSNAPSISGLDFRSRSECKTEEEILIVGSSLSS